MRKNLLIFLKQWILVNKFVFAVIILGVFWELLVYSIFPKQAWVDGLMEGWYMSQGLVIYKDSASMYFPLLYLLMIPFHQLFGFTQTPTLLLAPINSLVVFSLLVILSLRCLKGWYRALPLIFFLVWDPYLSANRFASTAFLNLTTFLAFIFWWKWYQNPRKITAFFLGFFLGVSTFCVQIVIPFVMVVVLSMIYRVWKERNNADSLLSVLIGFLIPAGLVLIWLWTHNGLGDFWTRTIAYYFTPSGYPYVMGRGRDNILVFVAIFSPLVLVLGNIFSSFYSYSKVLLSNLHKKQNTLTKKSEIFLSQEVFVGLILLSFLLPYWFAVFHYSRFQSSLAICSFAFGLAIWRFSQFAKKQVVVWLLLGVIIISNLVGLFLVAIPKYQSNWNRTPRGVILTELQNGDPFVDVIKWIKTNTPKDSRLFAMTDSLIYLEANRLPVNSHATSNLPVAYEPFEQFKQKLKNRPPDFWVIDERQWKRFHEFGYDHTTIFLKGVLECEPIAVQIEYITVRKHTAGSQLCF